VIFAGRTKTARLLGSSAQSTAKALLSELVGGD